MAAVAGSRNRRPLEESEDGDQPDLERQHCVKCSCSPSQTPPLSHGLAASPASVRSASGSFEEDLDETILDPSDEEKPDSPTGLSREAEDALIAEDLESSPDSAAAGLSTAGAVESVSILVFPKSFRPLRAPDEPESMKAFQRNGPIACSSVGTTCRNFLERLGGGKPLNTGSQIHAESSPNCDGLKSPEAASDPVASLNLEQGRGLTEIINKQALRTGTSQLAAQRRSSPVAGQASFDSKELRDENASNSLPGKAIGFLGKAAASTRVNGIQKPSSPVKSQQICIQEADLESSKERYVNAVLNHASSVPSVIDSVQEMYSLIDTVASESRYEHPTDLTVRNFARRNRRITQKSNLSQWVDHNLRHFDRFSGIPDYFKRSPVLS